MKQLLVILLLLCSASVSAQDVIVKKDGSTVVCRVVEVTATEITYKKWSDHNGSNYVMDKSLASGINYESGKKETFSETESLYKPNNQNDGAQQYNDRALLALDYETQKPNIKKAKAWKTIGWLGGAILVGGGLAYNYIAYPDDDDFHSVGFLAMGAGVACTAGCLLVASNLKKKEQLLYSTVYQRDFKLSNGSSLSLGADMLRDRTLGSNTIGLGLRYNF